MIESSPAAVPFSALADADLTVDAVYAGGSAGNTADDPISKIFQGVGNQGGFRYAGSPRQRTVKLAILYTTGTNPDWPDELDIQTGRFIYYGDNRRPGHELHDTSRRGNQLLRDVFAWAHGTAEDRAAVPPFLLFEKDGPRGRDVRFRGLLAPGAEGVAADEDLVAIWRSTGGHRFQNYRAVFTVLDAGSIKRDWINGLLKGGAGAAAPQPWQDWVAGRRYTALAAPATTIIRTPAEQAPDAAGQAILREITSFFNGRYHEFEACALELWRMQAPATGHTELTPPSRDGGRDAIGEYLLGPQSDPVAVEFALEAKCYGPDNSVGVREMSRLISRLKNRQFGVFVTTSFFNRQVYQEVREDRHPVVLMCGKDIVALLRSRGYAAPESVRSWLQASFG